MVEKPIKIDAETGRIIATRDIAKDETITLDQEEYRALSASHPKCFIGQKAILGNAGLSEPYAPGSLVVVCEQSEEETEKPFGILLVRAEDLKPDTSHPIHWVAAKDLILKAVFSYPSYPRALAFTLDDLRNAGNSLGLPV